MPIPDEKARAWTRPEDYWPPRLPARALREAAARRLQRASRDDRGDPTDAPRLLLGFVPYALLMLSLAVLAAAIMVVAWPGRQTAVAPSPPPAVEVGTAPPGWLKE